MGVVGEMGMTLFKSLLETFSWCEKKRVATVNDT